jgi:hypothetical protein
MFCWRQTDAEIVSTESVWIAHVPRSMPTPSASASPPPGDNRPSVPDPVEPFRGHAAVCESRHLGGHLWITQSPFFGPSFGDQGIGGRLTRPGNLNLGVNRAHGHNVVHHP